MAGRKTAPTRRKIAEKALLEEYDVLENREHRWLLGPIFLKL
jgi:hypothetical protein